MSNHRIDRAQWGAFFDDLSRHVDDTPTDATARVFAVRREDYSGEREDAWGRVTGVTWESKKGTVTVALDGRDHRIEGPRDAWVDGPEAGQARRVVIYGPGEGRDGIVSLSANETEAMELVASRSGLGAAE